MTLQRSRRLSLSEVPIIDVAPLANRDKTRAQKTIDDLASACSEVGFMYVKNHGISSKLVYQLATQAKRFFALSYEQKMKVAVENSPIFRGYFPPKYRSVAKGINVHEGFIIFREGQSDGDNPMAGPNQWPTEVPGLKNAMLDYFAAAGRLAHALLPGFAMALGLSREFFDEMYDNPLFMMTLNHYPSQEVPKNADEIGVVGHSDSGGFTILWQDSVGGLELLNRQDEWVMVPPIENAFVLNLGDMMQIWTNGHFSSTPHRVINTYGKSRLSIPLFANPNYFTVVKPLIGEVNPDFVPFTSGEYHTAVYRRIYPQRSAQAVHRASPG
jgi:isopenicillin N synthase-like dioxygenase